MGKINKILAPTDLSELSKDGVRRALELGGLLGAEVTVCHVVSYGEINPQTFPPLDRVVQRHQTCLRNFVENNFVDLIPRNHIKLKVEIGIPDHAILEEALKDKIDLIVMSTHGRTGFSHLLMGSMTEKIIRKAPCPVISINPAQDKRLEHSLTTAA